MMVRLIWSIAVSYGARFDPLEWTSHHSTIALHVLGPLPGGSGRELEGDAVLAHCQTSPEGLHQPSL